MNKVYVVTMYRHACREAHSYVLGAWSRKYQAIKAADEEEDYRGGKYIAEIIEVVMNQKVDIPKAWTVKESLPIGYDYSVELEDINQEK